MIAAHISEATLSIKRRTMALPTICKTIVRL